METALVIILNIKCTTNTCLIKTHDVIPQVGAPCGSHDLDPSEVLAELNADLAHLQGQLSCWHHYYGWIETEMGRADEMQGLMGCMEKIK